MNRPYVSSIVLLLLCGTTLVAGELDPKQREWHAKYHKQKNAPKPEEMLLNVEPEPSLQDGFVSLFNGRDLTGWTAKGGTCKFSVRDGLLVGTCVPGSPSTYLSTTTSFDDFVFTCDMKWEVDINSGVMFRAKSKPGKNGIETVYGPQVEMEGFSQDRHWSGGVYGQSCGGYFYPLWLKEHKTARAATRKGEWNRVTVSAVGNVVKTWVNGVPAAHWVDDGSYPRGFFGLQVHKAAKGTVLWKNIRAKRLRRQPVKPRRPDLVVYLADDLSTRDLPLYGGTNIATPNISKLAEAGMTFNRAFVASPSCAPSRAALLTGLMPARNGAEENHSYPREDIFRLPQVLNELGYQTAAFGKVAHSKSAPDYHFETHDRKSNIPEVRASVRKFLENRTDKRPLALFVGVSNPHVPWPSESAIDPTKMTLPPQLLDTPQTRVQRSRYLQEVIDLDAYLGELRDLTSKHLSQDQVFVFSSDHGAQFPFGKWTLYDEGINVPLIVAQSGKVKAGSRPDAMVSWVDLFPTLIDVGGGQVPSGLDGRSFVRVLHGKTTQHRERVFATHSGDREMNVYLSRSIRTDRYKFIWNPHPEFAFTTHIDVLLRKTSGDYFKQWTQRAKTDERAAAIVARHHGRPEYELFDLKDDPHEQTNLAGQAQFADVQKSLDNELKTWIKKQGDQLTVFHKPRMLNEPATWKPRPKVWIYTDMSDSTIPGSNHRGTINDPDDISAMAGYLLMANMFDTKGIVIASTNRPAHRATPNQAVWANNFFGKPYRAEVAERNRAFGGGYPADIHFQQSCIKETAERFDPTRNYRSVEKYPTVKALRDEASRLRRGDVINVLCWGSLSEPAMLVKHCLDTKRASVLKRVRFIAHWTNSAIHQGSAEHPENVANCREDAAACHYLKQMALAEKITYHECGAIGQHGIVAGSPQGAEYYGQFKTSQLGKLFAEGKFVRGKVDHSDSATYWTLLGTWGVSLDDIATDGSNPPSVEKANQDRFYKNSKRIHDELLRRSTAVGSAR